MKKIFLLFVFLTSAGFAYYFLTASDEERRIAKRLKEIRYKDYSVETLYEEETSRPFKERVLIPLIHSITKAINWAAPKAVKDKLEEQLKRAGCSTDPVVFMFYKATVSFSILFFYILLLTLFKPPAEKTLFLLFGASFSMVLGFFIPDVRLKGKIKKRLNEIEKKLPDVLDLLCISVEAGLGFDGAVQKVSEKFKGPIGEEFGNYLKEVRVGKSRAEALRALSRRVNINDMKTFTAAIIQADQLGVSISKVLKIQSEQMRNKRRQMAEERAMKMPVKILFPLVFFIFPTVFIVILGPVVIQFITFFRKYM
ncbi:MAG: tight adherence protein [Thermosediminibacterales bacterium]|nr:tight adherence protein [Thermosediminibacterales bacterium]MDK2835966.1 tight adherence protein [Thermosediminibacterales bacterium]